MKNSSNLRALALFLKRAQPLSDFISIAIITYLFFSFLHWDVLSVYPASGGDMGSHFWPFKVLIDNSLPSFSLRNWNPGNLGGEPHFLQYFPAPFMVMAVFASVLPTAMAFNFGTLLPALLFPISMYVCVRALGYRFPAPIIAAILSMLMLYNEGQTMWGGNFLSLLAGQFAHNYGLVFFALGVGAFGWELRKALPPYLSSLLFAAVVCSHAYVAIAIPIVCLSFIFFYEFANARQCFKHACLCGLFTFLLSIWFVYPLVTTSEWTTAFPVIWRSDSFWSEFIPVELYPLPIGLVLGLFSVVLLRVLKGKSFSLILSSTLDNLYFWGLFISCLAGLYFVFPKIGLVDVRTLPEIQLALVLLVAIVMGRFLRRFRFFAWVMVIPLCLSCVWLVQIRAKKLSPWIKWNYSGWTTKATYPDLERLSNELSGSFSDGRVVYEHNILNNRTSSVRVFELIPYFMGRSTLESAYLQASVLAPMAFHIQALISVTPSCPFMQFKCPRMDLAGARAKLELLGVQDLILITKPVVDIAKQQDWLEHRGTFGFWHVYRLKDQVSYVSTISELPDLVPREFWKNKFLDWAESYQSPKKFLMLKPEVPLGVDVLDSEAECKSNVEVSFGQLKLSTSCPGKAHVLKFAYHSAWQSSGGEEIYLVSPGFIMIVPRSNEVTLTFGSSADWNFFAAVSLLTFIFVSFGGFWIHVLRFKQRAFVRKSRMLILLMSLVGSSLCLPQDSYASFLRIQGEGDFQTKIEGESLLFAGKYTIVNLGDEVAKSVFPEFSLGEWKWVGSERDLAPQAKSVWQFKVSIPFDALGCQSRSSCFQRKVPLLGVHPLKISRHYRDQNGHPFSAVNSLALLVGEVPTSVAALSKAAPFSLRSNVENLGSAEYQINLEVLNSSSRGIDLYISLQTSKEFKVIDRSSSLELKGEEQGKTKMKIENFSGLNKSSYSVSVIFQWLEKGIPVTYIHPVLVEIDDSESNNFPIMIPISIILSVLVFLVGFRYLKKSVT